MYVHTFEDVQVYVQVFLDPTHECMYVTCMCVHYLCVRYVYDCVTSHYYSNLQITLTYLHVSYTLIVLFVVAEVYATTVET